MTKIQTIPVKDLNLGGLSDSDYQGIPNSMKSLVGIDLHSNAGIIKAQQKLTKDSGSTVDELVKAIVACSDGSSYLFSSESGKIWKRTSAGVYTLEATNANGACLGAYEYNGYIYYASVQKLGRWKIGTAWSTRTDTWDSFTNADALYHPFFDKNGILYIGDGNLVAQVDDNHIFVADALDIPNPYRISALGESGEYLLIGTTVGSNVLANKVFIWDTWSVSWLTDDKVFEDGINAFLPMDNAVLLQAGSKGNLYIHDGQSCVHMKKINGNYLGTNKMIVNPNASLMFGGQTLIGVSNSNNNPCKQGVYCYGGYSAGYPKVLSLDYVISTGNLSNVVIGAISPIDGGFLVSWKDSNSPASCGIDKYDASLKISNPFLESRVYQLDRRMYKSFSIDIGYRSIPAGCDFELYVSKNYGAYSAVSMVQDTGRNLYVMENPISDAVVFQFMVMFQTSGNNTPEIETINLTLY